MKKVLIGLAVSAILCFGAGSENEANATTNDKLEQLTELASQGNATAQMLLAFKYYEKQDYKKAFEWFEKVANQGDAYAQYNLGNLYANGLGVKQDLKKAKEWFGKACDGGFQMACDNYKILNNR